MARNVLGPGRLSRWLTVLVLCAVIASMALGCAANPDAPTPAPLATQLPVLASAAAPGATIAPPDQLGDDEVGEIMRALICWYEAPQLANTCLPVGPEESELLATIADSGDRRFVAPLIDLLWIELGWERWIIEALTALSGERHTTAYEWAHWNTSAETPLPAGYVEWKGRLLSLVDHRYPAMLPAAGKLAVRPDQLIWAGTAPEETPPLTAPETVHRLGQRYLEDDDIVFGVFVDGQARAYPERILAWHEVISDELNGRSLLITHCTPCGAAAAYWASASNGERYHFADSGLVYRSRRVLYDEETLSLWDQVAGRPISGSALAADVELVPHLLLRTTWEDWSGRYPNTTVMSLDTGVLRNYDPGIALAAELAAPRPLFPAPTPQPLSGGEAEQTVAKSLVVGLVLGGESRAYPVSLVEEAGVLHDTIAGQRVVITSRGPGRGVAAYRTGAITFAHLAGSLSAAEAVDADGTRWFLDEEKLINVIDSVELRAVPLRIAYWFAWADAFPDTALVGADSEAGG